MISLLLLLTLTAPQAQQRCEDATLKELARESAVIMVADVREVEAPSPLQPWSGLVRSVLHVRYQVREVLKGPARGSQAWVGVNLFKNSPTAAADRPALSPDLFKENNRHLLFLKFEGMPPTRIGRDAHASEAKPLPSLPYIVVDSNCGAVMATPATVEAIRGLVVASPRGVPAGARNARGAKVPRRPASGNRP